MVSIAALEAAARSGSLDPVCRELLESVGDPRARAHVARIIEDFEATWTRHPETLAADLHRSTVGVEGLEALLAQWEAELDARGTWLRALRPAERRGDTLARLHASDGVELERLRRPTFVSDDEVAFFAPTGRGPAQVWAWARGQDFLSPLDAPEPARPPVQACRDHPELAARFCPPATDFDPPWPALEQASFRPSRGGERLLVYGPLAETKGSLIVLDSETLELLLEYEVDAPVLEVFDHLGSDTFVVVTTNGVIYYGPRWRQVIAGRYSGLAWSPSGRYLCLVTGDVAELRELDTRQEPEHSGFSLGLDFSPGGQYLLASSTVYAGVSGEPIMKLDLKGHTWLLGGPPVPTVHIGDELLLSFAGTMELWELAALRIARRPEDPVPTVAPRLLPEVVGSCYECVAYDAAGRCLAMVPEKTTQVELIDLPSGRGLTSVEFELPVDLLALSGSAELIAALGGKHVEVRRRSGERVFRGDAPTFEDNFHGWRRRRASRFMFSADGSRLALDIEARGAYVWELADGPAQPRPASRAEFDRSAQGPPGWQHRVEDGVTTFVEEPSGRRVAVSLDGPWLYNPARTHIVACYWGHFALEGISSRGTGIKSRSERAARGR